ncbi:MAG TPA: WbqC family protein [Methanobacteriaceae archaeon]|nr:WbqC family protein [Methanobacteriaceae archaeon]
MVIISGHQSAYLPWLGLFHKMALADIYITLDDVQFEKGSFINRNKIKTMNGTTFWLTVPIFKKGYYYKTIRDMEIDNSLDWMKKHWQNLFYSYQKAPYFESYAKFFENTYKKNWKFLIDLNEHLMKFFIKELNIDVEYVLMSDLKLKTKKLEMILEMCEIFDADIFIFGTQGQDYASPDDFKSIKTNPYFQDYNHPTYSQQGDKNFISHLSIVDLLFNIGPEKAKETIMSDNITKNELKSMF